MTVGKRFHAFRKCLKLTQEELAKVIDCDHSSISLYERDKQKPSYEVLLKLSVTHNLSIDWLYTGNGEMFLKSHPENSINASNASFSIKDSHHSGVINMGSNIAPTPVPTVPAPPTTTAIDSIQPYLETIAALKETIKSKDKQIEYLEKQVTTLENQLQNQNQNP